MGTILIKKTDGTQVRMTMEEFKVYKANLKNNNQTVVEKKEEKIDNITPKIEEQVIQPINQSVVESGEDDEEKLFDEADTLRVEIGKNETKNVSNFEIAHDLPAIITEQSLSTTTPVKAIFVDEAKYQKTKKPEINKSRNQEINKPINLENKKTKKQDNDILTKWNSEDHKSLLEEDDEEVKKHHIYTTLPSSNDELVNKILAQLSFSLPQDLSGRLQSLILSKIKDIRNDEQILEYAKKDKNAGGLGLSEGEADELIDVIKKNLGGKNNVKRQEVTEKIKAEEKVVLESISSKAVYQQKPRTVFGEKPVLHDITTPTISKVSGEKVETDKKSVGPLDELKTFDLKDWRRLANNPVKAGEELVKKFMVLKEDSYLVYLDGIEAWRQSPLYSMYKNIIATCVVSKQKIKDYLFDQDKSTILSSEEFDELVKVNKNLV